MSNIDFSLPVWRMTSKEFDKAVRDLESNIIREQRAEANQRDLARLGVKTDGQDDSSPPLKTGVETGTTSSVARAPATQGSSVSGDALTMTDSEWAATLRSLK